LGSTDSSGRKANNSPDNATDLKVTTVKKSAMKKGAYGEDYSSGSSRKSRNPF
jgi:hypothetical protein